MSYPGFNLKVRKVANGYTIHRTTVSGEVGGSKHDEDHDDHVAMDEHGLRALLHTMLFEEIELLEMVAGEEQKT